VYETRGTMVGGALVTVALIPLLHTYDLAFVVMLLCLIAVGALLWDITHFFTREFFATAQERLRSGGILALAMPSLPRA